MIHVRLRVASADPSTPSVMVDKNEYKNRQALERRFQSFVRLQHSNKNACDYMDKYDDGGVQSLNNLYWYLLMRGNAYELGSIMPKEGCADGTGGEGSPGEIWDSK